MKGLCGAAIAALIARAVLLAFPDLLVQEAYYWNYAKHLDLGYLDHPPLSAWMVALSQKIFGLNEFAVRFPALVCALVMLCFVYRLAGVLYDRSVAKTAAALACVLPYFFGAGFFVSPDAPLLASWAAALYFAWRIVSAGPTDSMNGAWIGVGVSFGLGMLSKYTIVLCGAAFVLYLLLDRAGRRWFLKPQPYLAALVTLLIFSPVMYWNATHDWASFVFQGSRRLEAKTEFSLHLFIAQQLLLVTPAGLLAALFVCAPGAKQSFDQTTLRFARIFFLLPVVVFAFFSISHEPKFIWCGPAYLALLPLMAKALVSGSEFSSSVLHRLALRIWPLFSFLSAAGFILALVYLGPGLPFAGYKPSMNRFAGWQKLGEQVLELSTKVSKGENVVIGMDKHYTAAELSFYVSKAAAQRGIKPPDVIGRSVFGLVGLMWHFWQASGNLHGKSAVLVSRYRADLELPEVSRDFERLEPITDFRSDHAGKAAGLYYLRVAHGFRGKAGPAERPFFVPD